MLQLLNSAAPKQIHVLQYIVFRSNTQIRVSRLKRSMRSGGVSELVETGSSTKEFVILFISLAIKFVACNLIMSSTIHCQSLQFKT